MYDIASKTWSQISIAATNPPSIAHVAGYLVKQLDNTICDAIVISSDDKKMHICR
jgi:hypothetical protein